MVEADLGAGGSPGGLCGSDPGTVPGIPLLRPLTRHAELPDLRTGEFPMLGGTLRGGADARVFGGKGVPSRSCIYRDAGDDRSGDRATRSNRQLHDSGKGVQPRLMVSGRDGKVLDSSIG